MSDSAEQADAKKYLDKLRKIDDEDKFFAVLEEMEDMFYHEDDAEWHGDAEEWDDHEWNDRNWEEGEYDDEEWSDEYYEDEEPWNEEYEHYEDENGQPSFADGELRSAGWYDEKYDD